MGAKAARKSLPLHLAGARMSFVRKITAGQKRPYYEDRMNDGEKSDNCRVSDGTK
jgi:hypothetical protein